ncbi:aminoglycoside adenylyltransferase domain-containing protein [Rhizomonospora bruguierae]|uniref:aminoglycoside adenylyltransferase domain-containing protein n=1 Tax=Rhizomonospora bruguierae TaxID=1581705 RepID=UPI0020C094E7|nr:aminoglycoside adenylyltransferase domain-containing protein [Micromonospora sp. NBRC 107566]
MNQAQHVARLVADTLGSKALGIYLHGSAVQGGLKPASDVDILVVTRHTLDDRERRTLTNGLRQKTGTRPVELTVVVQSTVRPWRYPPTGDFLYGEWLRDEIAANGPPQPSPMPNLAIEIPQALAGNHPLAGPPPADLLDPVPPADVARASVAGIPDLLANLPGDTRNVVLTFARIWTTLATGTIRSKDEAADWALPRLPPDHRPVLQHAHHLYLTRRYAEETWPDDLKGRAPAHVDAVLAEIDKLTAHSAASE